MAADRGKEKPMSTTTPIEVAFAPLQTRLYVQTGNPTEDGTLPDAFGTPPQLYWIRDEEGFAKLGYQRAKTPTGAPIPDSTAPGELDFTRKDVILLSMGVQGTTGYSLSLRSVRKTGRDVRFILETKSPGPKDMVGEALTHPAIKVQVEKLPRDSRLIMVMDGKEPSFEMRVLD